MVTVAVTRTQSPIQNMIYNSRLNVAQGMEMPTLKPISRALLERLREEGPTLANHGRNTKKMDKEQEEIWNK